MAVNTLIFDHAAIVHTNCEWEIGAVIKIHTHRNLFTFLESAVIQLKIECQTIFRNVIQSHFHEATIRQNNKGADKLS
ncbi:hypothetical protein D3C87_1858340 [compost metagenome]